LASERRDLALNVTWWHPNQSILVTLHKLYCTLPLISCIVDVYGVSLYLLVQYTNL